MGKVAKTGPKFITCTLHKVSLYRDTRGRLRGLVDSGLEHRSLPPELECRRGHI